MANINVNWTAAVEESALASLAGAAKIIVPITGLDTQAVALVHVLFNEHASATAGLLVTILERTTLTGLGTKGIGYASTGIGATLAEHGTRLETTVDADSASGQKVLNTTATTNAVVGRQVIIAAGDASFEEVGTIASIQAGVSITLQDNMAVNHNAAEAHTVEECVSKPFAISRLPDAALLIENLDGTNACEFAVFNDTMDWVSV